MDTDQSTAGAQSKLKTNNKTCLNLSLKHVKTSIICLWLLFLRYFLLSQVHETHNLKISDHNMFSSKTNM